MFDFWNLNKYKKKLVQYEESAIEKGKEIGRLKSEINKINLILEETDELNSNLHAELNENKKKLEEKEEEIRKIKEIPEETKREVEKKEKAFKNLMSYSFEKAIGKEV